MRRVSKPSRGLFARRMAHHRPRWRDFSCPDLQRLPIDPDVEPAPDPPLGATMPAGGPLAFAFSLDAGAVDRQGQRPIGPTMGDTDLQGLLATAERAEVRSRPGQTDQPQQALDEPCGLSQRHAEQNLHRHAGQAGGIAAGGLAATFAGRRGFSGHGGVKPCRQRTPALWCCVIGGPVPGLV